MVGGGGGRGVALLQVAVLGMAPCAGPEGASTGPWGWPAAGCGGGRGWGQVRLGEGGFPLLPCKQGAQGGRRSWAWPGVGEVGSLVLKQLSGAHVRTANDGPLKKEIHRN